MVLGCMAYQDIKDRKVFALLFLFFAVFGSSLHYQNTMPEVFFLTVAINLGFTAILLLMIYLYSKIKLKINITEALGLGDILFFIALALSFATITFITTFVFALVFSLLMHLFLKSKEHKITVPLAGYMSLFYIALFLGSWLGIIDNIYQY